MDGCYSPAIIDIHNRRGASSKGRAGWGRGVDGGMRARYLPIFIMSTDSTYTQHTTDAESSYSKRNR